MIHRGWRGWVLGAAWAVGFGWAAMAAEADGYYGVQMHDAGSGGTESGGAATPVRLRSNVTYAEAVRGRERTRPAAWETMPDARSEAWAAPALESFHRNAWLTIGGEVNLDYYFKHRDAAPGTIGGNLNLSEWTAPTANLRLTAQSANGIKLYMKLDLAPDEEYNQDTLLEECRFAFENIYGSSWSLVFGKGEAPYGQDRTLGIIQSYHHNADAATSKEGPILVLFDENEKRYPANAAPGNYAHPGEIDRVYMLGVGWTWRDRVKVEAALFQKDREQWDNRSADGPFGSMSARVWWLVNEHWTLEASGLRLQSRTGRGQPGHKDESYAASLGFDGTGECWDLFGEWQHSWDWDHTDGFHTDTFQLGGAWRFDDHWQFGVMAEWLRSRNPKDDDAREDWYRGVASLKYRWDNGMFAILEYGHEWFRGRYATRDRLKAQGDLLAFRFGWMF